MNVKFDRLSTERYDLSLPIMRFSELKVMRQVTAGFLYRDSLTVESTIDTFAHVEVVGSFLHGDVTEIEGKRMSVGYRIETDGLEAGRTYEGAMIFTYLGGETVIPFEVSLVAKAAVDAMDKPSIAPVSIKNAHPQKPPQTPYSIKLNKKVYRLDEQALISITNHQPYPIAVKVVATKDSLVVSEERLTVQDRATLTVDLKRRWYDRVMRTYKKTPEISQNLTLKVRHETGVETVVIPLTFSNLSGRLDKNLIGDDRHFRQHILRSQQCYNRYIISKNPKELQQALDLVGEAMAYDRTQVDLRLFHMLLLLEQNRKDEVRAQVNEMIQYSSYYLEERFEAFMDILTVLGVWLNEGDVQDTVARWPLTPYRQIFRLRVFQRQGLRFGDFEALYHQGFRNTHFFAHVVQSLNEQPMVPVGPSTFYGALLQWAISKGALSSSWLLTIDKMPYQVMRHNLVTGRGAWRLYDENPSDGLLLILLDRTLQWDRRCPEDHAICQEGLRRGIRLQGLEAYYVRCAHEGALPIDLSCFHVLSVFRQLPVAEAAYLAWQYVQEALTDKSPHNPFMRQLNRVLPLWVMDEPEADVLALARWDIHEKAQKGQWMAIEETYGATALIGLKLLPKNTAYIGWLIAQGRRAFLTNMIGHGHLDNYEADVKLSWVRAFSDLDHNLGDVYARRLYEEGIWDGFSLGRMVESLTGSLAQLLDFYEMVQAYDLEVGTLVRQILYKGVLTRLWPERVLTVYLTYRHRGWDEEVMMPVNLYFAARIVMEEPYGYGSLMAVFESDLTRMPAYERPMALALLKLYKTYGANPVIAPNLIKNAVSNGIILPWFIESARPFMGTGAFRKAAFFSYNSSPGIKVWLHYRGSGEMGYRKLAMTHVCFGLYTGYVVAFYNERIQYYIEEVDGEGQGTITQSDVYTHRVTSDPLDWPNDYDAVNTILMAREMADEASEAAAVRHHLTIRRQIREGMTLL